MRAAKPPMAASGAMAAASICSPLPPRPPQRHAGAATRRAGTRATGGRHRGAAQQQTCTPAVGSGHRAANHRHTPRRSTPQAQSTLPRDSLQAHFKQRTLHKT